MIELGPVAARWPDLLRLLAVPILVWAAIQDIRVRRVPDRVWLPLLGLGLVALIGDVLYHWTVGGAVWLQFLIGTGVSIGLLVPLAYGFWLIGGFGGADAKGLMTLAVLFPIYPFYDVAGSAYPLVDTTVGAFALTILTNAVLVSLVYPLALGGYNLLTGHRSRVMLFGRPRHWRSLPTAHGQLLETPSGFTRNGLDLDALRMYLRWRDIDITTLRQRATELRDPATLPDDPNPPTDGAITDGGSYDDPWGAAAFLDEIDHSAYGTDPKTLRDGLEVVTTRDRIWVSPGIPFFVPLVGGLLVALLYGDVLFSVLQWAGLV